MSRLLSPPCAPARAARVRRVASLRGCCPPHVGRTLALLLGAALLWLSTPQLGHAQERDPAARAQRAQAKARKKRVRERASTARPSARGAHNASPAGVPSAPSAADPHRRRTSTRAEHAHSSESAVRGEAGPSTADAARAAAAGVDSQIVKEGDTSVKVMKFEGLGIEGRLKSPQLVYFVERTRAEFQHPTLAHRSFLPELQRTTQREPVR